MPIFRCPHCNVRINVGDHQVGKLLTCSKCGGRFLAEPELPADVHVENYEPGEAPPIQIGSHPDRPSDPPPSQPPPRPPGPFGREPIPRAIPVRLSPGVWKGADTRFGWSLLIAMIILEVLAGFAFLGFLIDSPQLRLLVLIVIMLLVLVHSILWIVAIFHVVAQSRSYAESIAPWLLVFVVLQGLGLVFYLVSRPPPED
jgi:Zn-finger nucleic acid-binding protein